MLFSACQAGKSSLSFSLLLSILEVQWDLAILMVLASLDNPARLSLQWSHQDPTDQERYVDFFARLSQADIRDITARAETGSGHPKNMPKTPGKCRTSLVLKLDAQMIEHCPVIVEVPVPTVGMRYCFPASMFCSQLRSLLESMLEVTLQ